MTKQPGEKMQRPTEILTCQAGHEFERPIVKGPKPAWCEEHRRQFQQEKLAAARKTRAENRHRVQSEEDKEAERLLSALSAKVPLTRVGFDPIDELRRKLVYAHAHAHTSTLMRERRDDLIREARKQVGGS